MPELLFDGPSDAEVMVLLAHGAGGPMDSAGMTAIAQALADEGLAVARFEFAYMASRRNGSRKSPPKAERLIPELRAHLAELDRPGRRIIGGKSMGGRVASLTAAALHAEGAISGLLCLGYPFHPPGRPDQLRTSHLAALQVPTLICQGTRDPFGSSEEVAEYRLSDRIELLWLDDGDHDLKPRKRLSGYTAAQHLKTVAKAVSAWSAQLA